MHQDKRYRDKPKKVDDGGYSETNKKQEYQTQKKQRKNICMKKLTKK